MRNFNLINRPPDLRIGNFHLINLSSHVRNFNLINRPKLEQVQELAIQIFWVYKNFVVTMYLLAVVKLLIINL